MKTCLCIVLIFNLIGCSNHKSNPNNLSPSQVTPIKAQSNSLDKKKIQLIETVLNLPGVIKFSKLEYIRRKYGNVYILIEGNKDKDSISSIVQNGRSLSILRSLDSLRASDHPCYVFEKIDVRNDSAYVRMVFDITGAMAFGNLNYVDGHWVPDPEFIVGVR